VVRRRGAATVALACALTIGPVSLARAASVVFDGDPIDAGSGQPYEILPGQPLVTAGRRRVAG
jgi:hypothetical protein